MRSFVASLAAIYPVFAEREKTSFVAACLTPLFISRKMKSDRIRGCELHTQKETAMSFQICINTDKSLHQLATEIRKLLSLPSFQETPGESYCQFEMLGMTLLIHQVDEEDR